MNNELGFYSVKDVKAGAWLPPFHAPTDAVAVRSIQDAVNDPDHVFSKHAEDFSLWKVGIFDQARGELEPYESIQLVKLVELVRPNTGLTMVHEA